MPPLQPEDNTNDILIDATMETNDKLGDIAMSNDIQIDAINEGNSELNELNRTADILVEILSKNEDSTDRLVEAIKSIEGVSITINVNGENIESVNIQEDEE